MRSGRRALSVAATLLAAGGFLLAGPGTGCSSFLGEALLVTTDFCFVFDCQSGLFGGAIDPCPGIGSGNQTVEGASQLPLFTDCSTGGFGP